MDISKSSKFTESDETCVHKGRLDKLKMTTITKGEIVNGLT